MKKYFLLLFILSISFSFSRAQSSICPNDLIPKRYISNGKMGFVDLFDNWKVKPKYFEVSPFEGRFAKVRFGDFYGMINCEGKEIVPPEFDELSFFSFGRIWAKNKKGWFLWDSSGIKLNDMPFDNFKRASIWHSYAWVIRSGKWKILNEQNGKFICDKEFTTVKLLSDTLSLVSNDGYFGILNHKNCNFKIPESIVRAQKVSSNFIKLRFRNRKYDIINLKGESILQSPYDEIESAGHGLAKVKSNEKWGLITASGKEVLVLDYDSIKTFHYGKLALLKENKWFYINEKLFPINDSLYDLASNYSIKGAIVKKNESWAVIDHKGEMIHSGFDSIIENKGLFFAKKDLKWFLLSETENNENFEFVNFSDGLEKCRVQKNDKWGLYDFKKLKWNIAADYSNINFISEEKLIVQNNNKNGLIDLNGKIIIPIQYTSLEWQVGFRNNLFIAHENGYKLINEKENSILESNFPIYRQGSLFILKDEKKKYLYESDGDLVFEGKVDSILVLEGSSYFAVLMKGKWGLLDVKGKELLGREYEQIKVLSNNFIALKADNHWQIFKQDGKNVIGDDTNIIEVLEVVNNSFIVKTDKGTQWINNSYKVLDKRISEYKLLKTGQVAIRKNAIWTLRNKEGKTISEKKFEAVDKKNGLELLQSNSKLFQINSDDQLSVYLPFD